MTLDACYAIRSGNGSSLSYSSRGLQCTGVTGPGVQAWRFWLQVCIGNNITTLRFITAVGTFWHISLVFWIRRRGTYKREKRYGGKRLLILKYPQSSFSFRCESKIQYCIALYARSFACVSKSYYELLLLVFTEWSVKCGRRQDTAYSRLELTRAVDSAPRIKWLRDLAARAIQTCNLASYRTKFTSDLAWYSHRQELIMDEIPERDVTYHLTCLLIYHGTTTHLYSCFMFF